MSTLSVAVWGTRPQRTGKVHLFDLPVRRKKGPNGQSRGFVVLIDPESRSARSDAWKRAEEEYNKLTVR